MDQPENKKNRPPRWFVVVIVVTMLPILLYPWFWAFMQSHTIAGIDNAIFRPLLYLLPIYMLATGWVSCYIYAERRVVAWLLQILLLLCYVACLWIVWTA